MKVVINNDNTNNKELCYEESFWTGKKTIKYNGVLLTKISKTIYEYSDGEIVEQFEVKGNQILGVTIKMFGNVVEILRKLMWYEIVMSVVVFIPCILFGAVGGAIGGALGFVNLVLIRNLKQWWIKLIFSIEFLLVSVLLSYIFAFLIFKTFMII